ncbi:hypothetical protein [Streptomyces sp. NPDC007984]|uniref:hypothetical protein n=1 Tax=Streptomyces sp. NPDC007984 TaxID=3364801 RepID=UPI0036E4C32B
MRISTRVTEHGPLFDGRARVAVRGYVEDLEHEGAEWALGHIRSTFHREFKNPTGYYESHVQVRSDRGDPVVSDGGQIAYGPWLEGVGSRNDTTRFKGYWAFRKAASALERRIEGLGYQLLERRWIRRMN